MYMNQEQKRLNPKTAIITGASRGIGKAIALEFAHHQWNLVILSSKSKNELFETKAELEALGSHCLALIGDVGNSTFVKEVVLKTKNTFHTIDCLVNNAGISYIGLITDMTDKQWNHILSVNLSSVFYFSREVIPSMVHQKSGSILNISSVWGEVGASCEAAYSATKGGINALTKSLAKELAPSNIKVNAISCGAIQTSMNQWLNEEERLILQDEIPLGRLGTPEEIAEFAYSLAHSPSYLTGQVIRMDGGWI